MNHAATQNLILNVDPNFSYVEQKELPFVSGVKAISFILKKEFRSFKKQETSLSVRLLFNVESAAFLTLTPLPSCLMPSFKCVHLCRCLWTCVHCLRPGGWYLPHFSDWEVGSPGPVCFVALFPLGFLPEALLS